MGTTGHAEQHAHGHRHRFVGPAALAVVAALLAVVGSPARAAEGDGYDLAVIATGFNFPGNVVVDAAGVIYVADTYNHQVKLLTTDGDGSYLLSTIAGTGTLGGVTPGPAEDSTLNFPYGVAVDGAGVVYVTEAGNHQVQALTPDGDGSYTLATIAGAGGPGVVTSGPAEESTLNTPRGVAADAAGVVYVADTYNDQVQALTPDGDGTYTLATIAGIGGDEGSGAVTPGPAEDSKLYVPSGVAVDGGGVVYVADTFNDQVQALTPDGDGSYLLSTIAGIGGDEGSGAVTEGPAKDSKLNHPRGVAVDAAGVVYVADYGNHQVQALTPDGDGVYTLSKMAGTGTNTAPVAGDALSSGLGWPWGAAVDSDGTVYASSWTGGSVVALTPPVLTTGVVDVTGDPVLGSVLTVDPGTWGPSDAVLTYQWLRDGAPILGATETSYLVTVADIGSELRVSVTGTRALYRATTAVSEVVHGPRGYAVVVEPTVSGGTRVGRTLTVNPGYVDPMSGTTFSYQWHRDGVPIDAATARNYTLTAADLGAQVTVTVTARHTNYVDLVQTTEPTGLVTPGRFSTTTDPVLAGKPKVGTKLRLKIGTWLPAPTVTYAWYAGGTRIKGATKPVLKLTKKHQGKRVKVTATLTTPGYKTKTITKTTGPVRAKK